MELLGVLALVIIILIFAWSVTAGLIVLGVVSFFFLVYLPFMAITHDIWDD